MNIVWTLILTASLTLCLFTDADVLTTVVQAGKSGLELSFSLCAVYLFWCGIFNVLTESGIINIIAKAVQPVISKIYGAVSVKSAEYISLNLTANLLGVSNASTPSALLAIGEIKKENGLDRPQGETAFGEIDNLAKRRDLQDKPTLSTQNAKEGKDKPALPKPLAMLFIINATSIQLLPTTVISMRAEYGSLSPTDITLPTLLCTALTTALGIVLGLLVFSGRAKK